jgi:hypothetical protein
MCTRYRVTVYDSFSTCTVSSNGAAARFKLPSLREFMKGCRATLYTLYALYCFT